MAGNNQEADSTVQAVNSKPKEQQANKKLVIGKSLGTVAGMSSLLPTGTTLAFQTMAPSFTKGGVCIDHDVSFAFTWGLIGFLTALCVVVSFTDSVRGKDGRYYYGVATPNGFAFFTGGRGVRELQKSMGYSTKELRSLQKRLRLRWQDLLHAVVRAAVFVTLALCDAGVQKCLVPQDSLPWKDFLANLPLAVGFLASFLLMVFPSTRKVLLGDDQVSGDQPEEENKEAEQKKKEAEENRRRFDRSLLGAAASLARLLPMGTTLAFQTLAPTFTRGGMCTDRGVHFGFTCFLIVFLALLCAALSFTDSVVDRDGHTYYGVATPSGIWLFNCRLEDLRLLPESGSGGADGENQRKLEQLELLKLKEEKKWKPRDCVHAVLSAAVFFALAFCDAGVQDCLLPAKSESSDQWREFVTLMPLAVGLVASLVFVVLPTTRKRIVGEEGAWDTTTTKQESSHDANNKQTQTISATITQVAPSSGCDAVLV